jgi:hypothetical protein
VRTRFPAQSPQSLLVVAAGVSRYTRPDNPLHVVETGGGTAFARFCFYALGEFSETGVAANKLTGEKS